MKIELASDTMTPDLKIRLERVEHLGPALRKMGFLMAQWAQDAFRNPAKRAAEWAPLKPATEKKKKGRGSTLVYHGVLKRSPRVVSCDDRSVVVGSDRKAMAESMASKAKGKKRKAQLMASAGAGGSYSLAAIHQLGAPRAKIPARPFFPFSGRMPMSAFEQKCRKILEDYLNKGIAR